MAPSAPGFEPTRLTVARQRRRWNKSRLAREIGVTLRTISLYESGAKSPSVVTLALLSEKLGFPVDFFTRPQMDSPLADAASFRSQARRTGTERDAALAAGAIAFEFADWINGLFVLPEPSVPDLRGFEPETAARMLRSSWNLGERPIANTVHLLEAHGVRVFSMAEPGMTVDAYSVWRDDVPFIFLNTQKTAEHSRHDAMHELGHLVLHRHGAPHGQVAEREADAFASAFLLPREGVERESSAMPTLESLIPLKRFWKVSLASYVFRLHRLRIITDWHYRLLFTELSSLGHRRAEPQGVAREGSQVLEKVFQLLRGQRMSKASIAQEMRIPLSELDSLVFGLVVTSVQGSASSGSPGARSKDSLLRVIR